MLSLVETSTTLTLSEEKLLFSTLTEHPGAKGWPFAQTVRLNAQRSRTVLCSDKAMSLSMVLKSRPYLFP